MRYWFLLVRLVWRFTRNFESKVDQNKTPCNFFLGEEKVIFLVPKSTNDFSTLIELAKKINSGLVQLSFRQVTSLSHDLITWRVEFQTIIFSQRWIQQSFNTQRKWNEKCSYQFISFINMPFMSFDPTDNNFGPRIGSMVQVNFKTAIEPCRNG